MKVLLQAFCGESSDTLPTRKLPWPHRVRTFHRSCQGPPQAQGQHTARKARHLRLRFANAGTKLHIRLDS